MYFEGLVPDKVSGSEFKCHVVVGNDYI